MEKASVLGNQNDNANISSSNIIVIFEDKRLYSLLSLYQQKTIKNYQNFLTKDLKDRCIEIKQ